MKISSNFNSENSTSVPENSKLVLTSLEIAFNRLFAVLLVLFALPLLLNIFTLPTVIVFAVFTFFLWFGKKYHPVANILFLTFAMGVYFIPIPPIGWVFSMA